MSNPLGRMRRWASIAVMAALIGALNVPAAAAPTDSDGDGIADTDDVVANIGTIVSTDMPTQQSSTYAAATADHAVDGNRNGHHYQGQSVSITANDGPWWQVNLGRVHTLDGINLYNRTDGTSERLGGAVVMIATRPFTSTMTLDEARHNANWTFTLPNNPGGLIQIPIETRSAQYVRVQLPSGRSPYLQLAEVDVIGVPGMLNDADGDFVIDAEDTIVNTGSVISTGATASQSSVWTGRPNVSAGAAVDGNREGGRDESHALAITDDDAPWWTADIGGWHSVNGINIWNRTDGSQTLLAGAEVLLAADAFSATMTHTEARAHAVWAATIGADPGNLVQLAVPDETARFVRVQLNDGRHLGLAEVDVIATASLGDIDADGVADVDDTVANTGTVVSTGKPAIQSSDYAIATAERAVDGNRNGHHYQAQSVSITANDGPWWQVDLERLHTIDGINLYNRTDGTGERLANAVVMIAEQPFGSGMSLAEARAHAVFAFDIGANPQALTQIDVPDTAGQYVRIQLPSSRSPYLQLAEVDVLGIPGIPGDADADAVPDAEDIVANRGSIVSTDRPATQSSTYSDDTADRAVDGNRSPNLADDSIAITSNDGPWWQVDLERLQSINGINLYNRGDGSASRLAHAVVMIADRPFTTTMSLSEAQSHATWTYAVGTATPYLTQLAVPDVVGRYVRIQLPSGTTPFLQLAEVDVIAEPDLGDADGDGIANHADQVSNSPIVSAGQLATQSSTYQTLTADRAVDGNRSGDMADNSIAITADNEPWWQVDLGALHTVDGVNVYNRVTGASERLGGAVVMVAAEPFTADMGVAAARSHASWTFTIPFRPGYLTQIDVPDIDGRYLRIQLPANRSSYLQLAEVDVTGTLPTP
ncbi:MAG: discoidin domain-containing protein [Actinomycetota bacterium]